MPLQDFQGLQMASKRPLAPPLPPASPSRNIPPPTSPPIASSDSASYTISSRRGHLGRFVSPFMSGDTCCLRFLGQLNASISCIMQARRDSQPLHSASSLLHERFRPPSLPMAPGSTAPSRAVPELIQKQSNAKRMMCAADATRHMPRVYLFVVIDNQPANGVGFGQFAAMNPASPP